MLHRITNRGQVLSIATNKWLPGLGCFFASLAAADGEGAEAQEIVKVARDHTLRADHP